MRYRSDDGGSDTDAAGWFVACLIGALLIFSILCLVGRGDAQYGQDTTLCKQVQHDAQILSKEHHPWVISCNPANTGWTHTLIYERTAP